MQLVCGSHTAKVERVRARSYPPKLYSMMKQYKLESLIYYSKLTLDKEHIAKASSGDIQEMLDDYAQRGWRLVSTDVTDFGFAVYFYLYFEKDAAV